MGLLEVTGAVVSCNLLVGVQLGQLGRFGRLMYKCHKLMQVMPSNDDRLCKIACTRHASEGTHKATCCYARLTIKGFPATLLASMGIPSRNLTGLSSMGP